MKRVAGLATQSSRTSCNSSLGGFVVWREEHKAWSNKGLWVQFVYKKGLCVQLPPLTFLTTNYWHLTFSKTESCNSSLMNQYSCCDIQRIDKHKFVLIGYNYVLIWDTINRYHKILTMITRKWRYRTPQFIDHLVSFI